MPLQCSSFFFLQPEFIFRNPQHSDVITFEAENVRIFFVRVADALISLPRSPFGGFATTGRFDESHLGKLLEQIINWSQSKGISRLIIRSFPEAYDPMCAKKFQGALLAAGFKVHCTDISQVIAVGSFPAKLDIHKRRRIRQAMAAGYKFKILGTDHLPDAYSLIVESRESKGYPVTMTLSELQEAFERFDNRYFLFGVSLNEILIAAAVCIRVDSNTFYAFYLGDSLAHRRMSPVTFLVAGIHDYCRLHQYKLLDLGMSTDKGVVNKGLYNFKKTFGATDSFKRTFTKTT